ncbi:hypothetical protein GCM10010193_39430 [Kitasatospora atroaurantiaca]
MTRIEALIQSFEQGARRSGGKQNGPPRRAARSGVRRGGRYGRGSAQPASVRSSLLPDAKQAGIPYVSWA